MNRILIITLMAALLLLAACSGGSDVGDTNRGYQVTTYSSSLSDWEALKEIYIYCQQYNDGQSDDTWSECLRWNVAKNWYFPGGDSAACVQDRTAEWDYTMLPRLQEEGASLDEIFTTRAKAQSQIFLDCGGHRK